MVNHPHHDTPHWYLFHPQNIRSRSPLPRHEHQLALARINTIHRHDQVMKRGQVQGHRLYQQELAPLVTGLLDRRMDVTHHPTDDHGLLLPLLRRHVDIYEDAHY